MRKMNALLFPFFALVFASTVQGQTGVNNAQFIEFDASGGAGTIGSGTMERADTTAYSTARITGDYTFGAAGFDNANNRAAIEGRFTSNGTGTLTNPVGDVNAYGTDYAMNFTAANYAVSNTATGRGTMHLAFTFGGTPDSMNFVFYIVNSAKLFVIESHADTAYARSIQPRCLCGELESNFPLRLRFQCFVRVRRTAGRGAVHQ